MCAKEHVANARPREAAPARLNDGALAHGSSRRHAGWLAKMLTPTARDGH